MSKIRKCLALNEVNEYNIQKACKAITEITEEDFESLDSTSRKLLQNLIASVCTYLKSSGILESYQLRKHLKALSAEISSFSQQILTAHPVPCTFDQKFSGLTYHELENLAKSQQTQLKSALSTSRSQKNSLKSRSNYLYHHINLLKSPNFHLMLFEYSEGVPSFFPHEDHQIETHKKQVSQEIEAQFNMLIENYGEGSIKKIVKTRKKWDLDYCEAYHKMKKGTRQLNKFSGDVLEDSDIFMKSLGFKTDQFMAFGVDFCEGHIEYCVVGQICNMDLCAVRNPVSWSQRETPCCDLEGTMNVFCEF